MAKKNPVDWWRVVTDIQLSGCDKALLYRAAGRSKSWARSLKNEFREPRHSDGEALIDLWAMVTFKPRAALPRTTPTELSRNRLLHRP